MRATKNTLIGHAALIATVAVIALVLFVQSLLAVDVALIADKGNNIVLSTFIVNASLAVTFFFLSGLLGLVTDIWLSGNFFKRLFYRPTPFEGWHWGLWLSVPYVIWIINYASQETSKIPVLLVNVVVLAFFSAMGSFTGVYVGIRRPSPKQKLVVIFSILLAVFLLVTFAGLLFTWWRYAAGKIV